MTLGDRLLLFAQILVSVPSTQKFACNVSRGDKEKAALPDFDNVIDVIAHRHEQIEKQFAPILHFHLHGSAPLESLATSDDQC